MSQSRETNSIIAIDPGQKYTGVVTRINNFYACYEFPSYRIMWDFLWLHEWDLVICENFTATFISSYGLETVRAIGGVEAICERRKIPMLTKQNVTRLKFIKNGQASAKVKETLGYEIRDHMRDAMAHLMAYEETET